MDDIYALLKLYGDRYINCSDEQALFDVTNNREEMIVAYNAIMHYAEMLK